MDPLVMLYNLVLIVISVGLMWKGSEWVVESASKIAHALGISDLVVGLTVVAIGTSAPEFAVTVSAILKGNADISVSNVVGSNIFNLGFILGGTAAFYAIKTSPKLVYRDGFLLIGVTLLLLVFLFDFHIEGDTMELTRGEGFVLIGILISYLLFLFIKKEPLDDEEISHEKANFKDVIFLLIGLSCVVGGGHLLVVGATDIAKMFGLSDWVIGVTIVAAGTSMPELATAVMAIVKGKHGMAIGNLIGSDLFNLLGVLGVAGILQESMTVSPEAQSSMYMLVAMVILVVIFMRTGWKITRLQGATLLLINLVRWVSNFTGQS